MFVAGIFGLLLLFVSLLRFFNKLPTLRTIMMFKELPGPKSIPIIGSLSNGIFPKNADVVRTMRDNLNKYGGFYASWSWGLPCCVLANPEDIAVVLKSDNISKGHGYKLVRDAIGEGLITSTGDKWKARRKILTPSYQLKFAEEGSSNFGKYLLAISDQFCSNVGKIVEPASLIKPSLIRLASEFATGTVLADNDQEVDRYCLAVQNALIEAGNRILKPYLKNDFIYKILPLSERLETHAKIMHRFIEKISVQKRAELDARLGQSEIDFELKKKGISVLEKLLMLKVGKKDISDEVSTCVIAAHETVSSTLNSAVFALSQYQDIQEKLFQEQKIIFGNDDRDVTAEDLSRMAYLTAFIKETLRMFTPTPSISRALEEDVILRTGLGNNGGQLLAMRAGLVGSKPNCTQQEAQLPNFVSAITARGRIVPAGTNVTIPIFYLHMDPKLFPNPTTFDPERFLGVRNENTPSDHPFAFIPFSGGPRNCVGKKFGMDQMKAVLSVILRRVKVWPVTRQGEEEFLIGVPRHTTKPVLVRLTARMPGTINEHNNQLIG